MLHPNQFQVNEAWIVFQLNDAPVQTAQEGSFNCVCLMDAASCFIFGSAFIPIDQSQPSIIEVRELLKAAWAEKQEFPAKLFVPTGQFLINVPQEAERQGIEVVRETEARLMPFIREARQAFRQYNEAQA